jgi:hypothetical protein
LRIQVDFLGSGEWPTYNNADPSSTTAAASHRHTSALILAAADALTANYA